MRGVTILAMVIYFLVGCRTLNPSGIFDRKTSGGGPWDFALFYDQVDDYLKRFHDRRFPYTPNDIRGHFSYRQKSDFDLYGSLDMVYFLYVIGELEKRTTPGGREQWIELIQAFQDPRTGLFDMGNNTNHSVEHATAYAAGALKLLGGAPRHEFKWARDIFASQEAVEQWLETFNWFQIWKESHAMGFAAAGLQNPELMPVDNRWSDWVINGLSSRVHEPTGFWQRGVDVPFVTNPPTTIALGGAAQFWWIYQCANRPMPLAEKAIESTLALQKQSGLWGSGVFNGDFSQSVDIDATNGLRYAYRALDPDLKEKWRGPLLQSLEKYFQAARDALDARGALENLYQTSHKLPGGLMGLAEANAFYEELTGEPKLQTPMQWQPVLPKVCWL